MSRWTLRLIALGYLAVLVMGPVAMILVRSFDHGIVMFYRSITTPAAISALDVTLEIIAIVIPLDVIFGIVAALVVTRTTFRGRELVRAVVDLPFAVSPIVVGVALIGLWGVDGWFGGVQSLGVHVIFGLPGMVLATLFVTLPFVVRELEPVLAELGDEAEQAAATLGASRWQTLLRITLPSLRWALTYGVVLTTARALGEFGAVIMVSSGLPGVSQTLTLLVNARYVDDQNIYGAMTAATLLMLIALATQLLMTVLQRRRAGGSVGR